MDEDDMYHNVMFLAIPIGKKYFADEKIIEEYTAKTNIEETNIINDTLWEGVFTLTPRYCMDFIQC